MDLSSDHFPHANGNAAEALSVNENENENATSRRKSGRVSKKPSVFSPNDGIARSGGSGKRKRASQGDDANQDDDASEESDEDEDEESEQSDETDHDEPKPRRRRPNAGRKVQRKATAKRPKMGGAVELRQLAVRPGQRRSAPRPRKPQTGRNQGEADETGLYADIFFSAQSLDKAAAEWLALYQQNNSEAMRDMVNFVLRAAGCDLKVSVHDIEDQDNIPGKLTDLQDEYQAQNITEYPLIAKVKSNPPFLPTLTGFFGSLIATAHASSILYDDLALIENIQVWITTMTSSPIRPFRHTATVISLAIVSTLCEVAAALAESDAKILRQLETEKQKKGRSNKGRISELQAKVDDGDEKRDKLEEIIKDIFDTVFVHRYRDVDPRIRTDCVHAIGYWITTLPDVFFDGQYLRYPGWILSDTSAPTRLEALKQLQRLIKSRDNVGGLQSFVERFRSRIIEMACRDADSSVRAAAVELLDMIRDVNLLSPDEIDIICGLVFDSEPRVRKAVAAFFAANIDGLYESKLEDLGGEETLEEVLAREGDDDFDNPRASWLKLKCLVEILQSEHSEDGEHLSMHIDQGPAGTNDVLVAAGVESRFFLATQAIYDKIPEVKEWEILAGYLLFDHSEINARPNSRKKDDPETALKRACKLEEKEEIALLDVLYATVKLGLERGGDDDATRKGKKRHVGKAENLESLETTARHLAQLIPRLLSKFGATPAAASAVLRLEQLLNLDVYQVLRQDATNYSSLLDDINKQFLTHGDQAVLTEASAALLHAKSFEELDEVTEGKIQHLWEDTLGTFQALTRVRDPGRRGNLAEQVLSGILSTVQRISHLASITDCIENLERAPTAARRQAKSSEAPVEPLRVMQALLERAITASNDELDYAVAELEDNVASYAMKSILFYFLWKFRSIKERLSQGRRIPEEEVHLLRERRSAFEKRLVAILRSRTGSDEVRLVAAGTLLDIYTLFATLREIRRTSSLEAFKALNDAFESLLVEMSPEIQTLITSVFAATEALYAKKLKRTLEVGEDDEPLDDEEEEEEEDEEDTEEAERARHNISLLYEQRLCELTGKIVLAIIAKVLDNSGPLQGKLKQRLQMNRGRLGHNFKEVVAHLDEPKVKKGGSKKTPQPTAAQRASEQVVVEDEDEMDDGDEAIEEGGEEDLRNRELTTAEDQEMESASEGEDNAGGGDVDDDIMGD